MNIPSVTIQEELQFSVQDLRESLEAIIPQLNHEQREIYDCVLDAVQNETSIQIFIDARGGCGKTFLLNAILKAVRSLEDQGCIALAMATTGIAANLLDMGRTLHSRLKAPLNPKQESVLNITVQSNLAEMIRMSKLLMIDESTMLDAYLLEAIDRSLRDIMDKPEVQFGGKIVILAGDFRQCLPVIPHARKATIIKRCINHSPLWQKFTVKRLTINMRVLAEGNQDLNRFDKWLLDIGNGKFGSVDQMLAVKIESGGDAIQKHTNKVFPDLATNIASTNWLHGRAILALTNQQVRIISRAVMRKLDEGPIR